MAQTETEYQVLVFGENNRLVVEYPRTKDNRLAVSNLITAKELYPGCKCKTFTFYPDLRVIRVPWMSDVTCSACSSNMPHGESFWQLTSSRDGWSPFICNRCAAIMTHEFSLRALAEYIEEPDKVMENLGVRDDVEPLALNPGISRDLLKWRGACQLCRMEAVKEHSEVDRCIQYNDSWYCWMVCPNCKAGSNYADARGGILLHPMYDE